MTALLVLPSDFAIIEDAAQTRDWAALTGSAFIVDAADHTKVTGTSATFLTEMVLPGDTVWLPAPVAQRRVVRSIASETVLYVSTAFTVIDTATDAFNLAYDALMVLGVHGPASEFSEFSQDAQLANGLVLGQGWATAVWRFPFLELAARQALRAAMFPSGVIPAGGARSARVIVRTRTNEMLPGFTDPYRPAEFKDFRGVMVWPAKEPQYAGRKLGLEVTFQGLREVAVP